MKPSQKREHPVAESMGGHESGKRQHIDRRPLRGQRRWGLALRMRAPSCFPFNRPGENPSASTNPAIVRAPTMAAMSRIDDLTERVERLLLRHEELQRTHDLLQQQLDVTTHERDSLKARLAAARARIDALIDKLPNDATSTTPTPDA